MHFWLNLGTWAVQNSTSCKFVHISAYPSQNSSLPTSYFQSKTSLVFIWQSLLRDGYEFQPHEARNHRWKDEWHDKPRRLLTFSTCLFCLDESFPGVRSPLLNLCGRTEGTGRRHLSEDKGRRGARRQRFLSCNAWHRFWTVARERHGGQNVTFRQATKPPGKNESWRSNTQ